jgi:TRIAD3 protein (E3 ubiquitin-protein ligase RNF216)
MPALRSAAGPSALNEGLSKCEEDVSNCFPDICPDYLKSQAAQHGWDAQALITHLLDDLEKGQSYPKRPNPLKRKRLPEKDEKGDEEEMRQKFEDGDPRLASKGPEYTHLYIKAA